MFTARYGLGLYIKRLRFVFKGLIPGFVLALQFTEPPVTDPKPVNLFVTPT